jgi:hypothetical protein
MSRKIFSKVGGLRPGKSVFNLSYEKKFDADLGKLIPVAMEEVVPGDVFVLGNNVTVRYNPLMAPLMHEVNVYTHYFFVPNRILDENWEDFITGGPDGQNDYALPRWIPESNDLYSLWDYLGLPPNIDPDGAYPLDYPRRAYNLIYNEYYRDENLIPEVDLDNEEILNRAWEKDYFTSALPWQQRGIAPALPITGSTNANFLGTISNGTVDAGQVGFRSTGGMYVSDSRATKAKEWFDNNVVDFEDAITFDVNDLRLAFQIQKWMERNARAGVRYTEFLKAHFGVAPRDERLDRPEYIGGSKNGVVISEVLQTSATDDQPTPQGNLAGHGISYGGTKIGTYRVKEYGWIVGLLSVMPRTAYQQGINRQYLRKTRFDFYSPEFANLSEQGILMAELYATNNEADNNEIFGFQGRYNEMRYRENQIAGALRTTLNYWHYGRVFANKPQLNEDFISANPRKDMLAVPTEKALIINYANIIKAIRPMPFISEPGLIDHH